VNSALGTPSEVEFSAEAIVIFPNPGKDRVSIHTNQPIHSLNIYTFLGQEVMSLDTILAKVIDLSELSKGVYFVKIQINDSEKRMTLVKD